MAQEMRILCVEDDPDGQELVSTILAHMNIPVDVAGSAEHAEELLFDQRNHYNAVVIDLALPGKDGWSLLSEIRANPATSRIPCIAVTAYHTSSLREEALMAGFTAYQPKPLDSLAFVRQVENVL
jgi:two-component system CheB/CheR fusion protein